MKRAMFWPGETMFVMFLIFVSCSKTEIQNTPPEIKNRTPIANAGPDVTFYMPGEKTLVLDGSNSYDPDLNRKALIIASWRKLLGDTVLTGYTQGTYQSVTIVSPGSYAFELSVEDLEGLVARDTVNITAALAPGCVFNQRIVEADFTEIVTGTNFIDDFVSSRAIVSNNVKLFLGGGIYWDDFDNAVYSASMWVLDFDSKRWKNFNLSMKRQMLAAAANDKLVLFAGGVGEGGVTDRVDIFDPITEKLTVAKISVARMEMSGATLGSKFIFAGGMEINDKYSDVVDIYDTLTKTWSSAKLSEPRRGISSVVSGTKVYFSGGEGVNGMPSNRIDIYDQNTGQWSVSVMNVPRYGVQTAVLGEMLVYWGGYDRYGTVVNKAELFNTRTQSSSVQCAIGNNDNYLRIYPANERIAALRNNTCYYASNFMLTKYDAANNSWSRSFLPYETDALFTYRNGLYLLAIGYQKFSVIKVTM